MKKHKNSGFSLVELIVVIALIAILTTIATISLSSVSAKQEKNAAEIICEMMSQCKMNTLSGMSTTLVIKEEDGEVVALLKRTISGATVVFESKKLGKGVKVSFNDKTKSTEIDAENAVFLRFDAGRGSVTMKINDDDNKKVGTDPTIKVSKNKTYSIKVYTYLGGYEMLNT